MSTYTYTITSKGSTRSPKLVWYVEMDCIELDDSAICTTIKRLGTDESITCTVADQLTLYAVLNAVYYNHRAKIIEELRPT